MPLPGCGALWLCGKHAIGPDPEGALARVGATTAVCLTERVELADRYPDYVAWLDAHSDDPLDPGPARARWFPIADLHAPDVDAIAPFVATLDGRLRAGDGLLVHCGAGIGRAGTLAVCLLVVRGEPLETALATVARHRPMAGPEVGAQTDLVQALAARLDGLAAGG